MAATTASHHRTCNIFKSQKSASRSIPWLAFFVLSGGTQRRALPWHKSEDDWPFYVYISWSDLAYFLLSRWNWKNIEIQCLVRRCGSRTGAQSGASERRPSDESTRPSCTTSTVSDILIRSAGICCGTYYCCPFNGKGVMLIVCLCLTYLDKTYTFFKYYKKWFIDKRHAITHNAWKKPISAQRPDVVIVALRFHYN